MKRIVLATKWIVTNIDWLLAIGLSIVTFVLGMLQQISSNLIFSVTLLILGLLSFSALRDRDTSQDLKREVAELKVKSSDLFQDQQLLLDQMSTGISRVYSAAVGVDWLPHIGTSHLHVTIISMRLGITDNPNFYTQFERILAEGGSVTLVLSDPRAVAMWLRYKEEPDPAKNPDAWTDGLVNLASNARLLHAWQSRLKSQRFDISRLRIRVFQHYPSQAFCQFDDSIYVYNFPYGQRGIHGPMFVFDRPGTGPYTFLLRCIDSIVESSVDLEEVFDDIMRWRAQGGFDDFKVSRTEIVLQEQPPSPV